MNVHFIYLSLFFCRSLLLHCHFLLNQQLLLQIGWVWLMIWRMIVKVLIIGRRLLLIIWRLEQELKLRCLRWNMVLRVSVYQFLFWSHNQLFLGRRSSKLSIFLPNLLLLCKWWISLGWFKLSTCIWWKLLLLPHLLEIKLLLIVFLLHSLNC